MSEKQTENIISFLKNEILHLTQSYQYLKDRMVIMEESLSISKERIIILEGFSGKENIKRKDIEESYMRPIEELGLTVRTNNCLKCENIYLVGDLLHQTEMDLLRTPNIGRKSLVEIKDMLQANGLSLNMGIHWPPSSEPNRHTPRELRDRKALEMNNKAINEGKND